MTHTRKITFEHVSLFYETLISLIMLFSFEKQANILFEEYDISVCIEITDFPHTTSNNIFFTKRVTSYIARSKKLIVDFIKKTTIINIAGVHNKITHTVQSNSMLVKNNEGFYYKEGDKLSPSSIYYFHFIEHPIALVEVCDILLPDKS